MRHAQLKAFHAVAMHGGFSRAAPRVIRSFFTMEGTTAKVKP